MSVPSGYKEVGGKKLPLGLQLFASHGEEETLFTLAKDFESK
jgi:Asp-tRNA(Asn)/Glu-tRNA(Gln) amidotransferase A subunit family amidase